jgi:hypothetical protein
LGEGVKGRWRERVKVFEEFALRAFEGFEEFEEFPGVGGDCRVPTLSGLAE